MHPVRARYTATLLLMLGAIAPIYAQHEPKEERQAKPQQRAEHAQQARPQQEQKQVRQAPQARPQQQRAEHAPAARPQQEQKQVRQAPQAQPQQQKQAQHAEQARPQQQKQPQHPEQARPQQQRAQQNGQARQQQQRQVQQTRRTQPQQQQPQRSRQQAVAWQQKRGWAAQGAWQPHNTWQQGRSQHWDTDHRNWGQRGGYGGYYIPQASFSLSFGNQHSFRMGRRPDMYMGYPRFAYGGYSFLLLDPWPQAWADNWYDSDDLYIDYDEGYYLHNRRYPGIGLAITVAM